MLLKKKKNKQTKTKKQKKPCRQSEIEIEVEKTTLAKKIIKARVCCYLIKEEKRKRREGKWSHSCHSYSSTLSQLQSFFKNFLTQDSDSLLLKPKFSNSKPKHSCLIHPLSFLTLTYTSLLLRCRRSVSACLHVASKALSVGEPLKSLSRLSLFPAE